MDGVAKAYDMSSQYQSASVVIYMAQTNGATHFMRPIDNTQKTPEIKYIPFNYDNAPLITLTI
jgi:hypothetical protein